MTPYHLHATAAAWSLRAARRHLIQLTWLDAAERGQDLVEAANISSPTYGTRRSIGGHADPVGATAERPTAREAEWADLLHRLDGRVGWLAGMLRQDSPNPLAAITAAIPRLQPGTARVVWQHLADEDRWVREACRLDPDRRDLTGIPCPNPRCGQRRLQMQTAGGADVWTVICGAGCLCVGQGCQCGMEGAVEGAPHIWPRTQVIA